MKFFQRLFSTEAIVIKEGQASCIKGKRTRRLLIEIADVARDCGVESGELWIDKLGRVEFSKEFSEKSQQRIRNVLAAHN